MAKPENITNVLQQHQNCENDKDSCDIPPYPHRTIYAAERVAGQQ